jgi:hypothetical protein
MIQHVNFAIEVMRDDPSSCVTRGRERSTDNEQVYAGMRDATRPMRGGLSPQVRQGPQKLFTPAARYQDSAEINAEQESEMKAGVVEELESKKSDQAYEAAANAKETERTAVAEINV